MSIKYIFYYGAYIAPILIMFILSWKKKPKYFLIGILLSIYIFNFLYSSSIWIDFLPQGAESNDKLEIINKHRGISTMLFNVEIYALIYNLFIGMIIWNFFAYKFKYKESFYTFAKSRSFYFIVIIALLIDILLGHIKIFAWDSMFLSYLLFVPFLLLAIETFFNRSKKNYKTSKYTLIILSLTLFLVLIMLYIFYRK